MYHYYYLILSEGGGRKLNSTPDYLLWITLSELSTFIRFQKQYLSLWKEHNLRVTYSVLYTQALKPIVPEGVQPLGLVAQNREEEMSELFKIFTFVFFFGFGLYLVQEKRGKKNFRIGQYFRLSDFQTFRLSDFQTFRLSVKICGKQNSKTIENFNIRPGEEKFCWDSAECPRHRCRPPPMPPLPPSPQKRVFPPNFKLLIAQKFLNFLK